MSEFNIVEAANEYRGLQKRKGALLVAATTIMNEAQAIEDRMMSLKDEIDEHLDSEPRVTKGKNDK